MSCEKACRIIKKAKNSIIFFITPKLKQFFNNPASKIVYDDVQYFPNDQIVKFEKDGKKVLELNLTNNAEWSQLGEQLANAGLGDIDEINDILTEYDKEYGN